MSETLVNKEVLKALTDAELEEKYEQYTTLADIEGKIHWLLVASAYAIESIERVQRRVQLKLTKIEPSL